MKSIYRRALEWLDADMTAQDKRDFDLVIKDGRVGDSYREGLVLGYLAGYRAGKADAERASKRKKRGSK